MGIIKKGEIQGYRKLVKTDDFTPLCIHPEHDPPKHIKLEPGIYEYTCPSCGKKTQFCVPLITY